MTPMSKEEFDVVVYLLSFVLGMGIYLIILKANS